ncbi:discoidin domain-containing receptor 2-like [Patiria miniata]|uniref:receptor protein-tyrosine kinase n=1 Tax=Patiria miniata TaxID=46514 RepID=A0A914AD20_PATMI|nr:discoidin domain-containing receptor 2-like [Patiria miniata]
MAGQIWRPRRKSPSWCEPASLEIPPSPGGGCTQHWRGDTCEMTPPPDCQHTLHLLDPSTGAVLDDPEYGPVCAQSDTTREFECRIQNARPGVWKFTWMLGNQTIATKSEARTGAGLVNVSSWHIVGNPGNETRESNLTCLATSSDQSLSTRVLITSCAGENGVLIVIVTVVSCLSTLVVLAIVMCVKFLRNQREQRSVQIKRDVRLSVETDVASDQDTLGQDQSEVGKSLEVKYEDRIEPQDPQKREDRITPQGTHKYKDTITSQDPHKYEDRITPQGPHKYEDNISEQCSHKYEDRIAPEGPHKYEDTIKSQGPHKYEDRIAPEGPHKYEDRITQQGPHKYEDRITPQGPQNYEDKIAPQGPHKYEKRISKHVAHTYEDTSNLQEKTPMLPDSGDGENILPPWAERWKVPRCDLIMDERVLGCGNFGEVRSGGVMKDGELTRAAIKMLKGHASTSERDDFINELHTLTSFDHHPNVVLLLGACQHRQVLYVALEYLPRGDLRSYLRTVRSQSDSDEDALSSDQLVKFALDVAKGMEHLAKAGVIHRDLAARNILLSEGLTAKVSDFGLSRGEDIYVQTSKRRFPVRWLAIESIRYKRYTTNSDVWSFGILLWEISTIGGTPYPTTKSESLARKLKGGYRMPKPSNCDDKSYALMRKCWEEDPNKRPSFSELVSTLSDMGDSKIQHTYFSFGRVRYENLSAIRPEFDDN